MDRPASRSSHWSSLLAGPLLLGMSFAATGVVRAELSGQGGSTDTQRGAADAVRRARGPAAGALQERGRPRRGPPGSSPRILTLDAVETPPARANRGQVMGDSRPIGGIVTWPMPPTLIIRHTPQVHDEIEGLLGLLRR